MDRHVIDEALAEYVQLRNPDGDPELEAVKAAIFVEDVFGVTLPDDDIDAGRLADLTALPAVIARGRESN